MTPDEMLDVLGRSALFSKLDRDAQMALVRHMKLSRFRKGETIFVEGEFGDRCFVIAKGRVRLLRRSTQGDLLELARRDVTESFGELALLDGGPRSASAETVTDTVTLSLDRALFIEILRREPRSVDSLLSVLGAMVREQSSRVAELVFLDLKGRVASRLIELADTDGELTRDRRVTQSELAQMVGGSRQTVNSVLQALQNDGIISTSSLGIRIEDRERLNNLRT